MSNLKEEPFCTTGLKFLLSFTVFDRVFERMQALPPPKSMFVLRIPATQIIFKYMWFSLRAAFDDRGGNCMAVPQDREKRFGCSFYWTSARPAGQCTPLFSWCEFSQQRSQRSVEDPILTALICTPIFLAVSCGFASVCFAQLQMFDG